MVYSGYEMAHQHTGSDTSPSADDLFIDFANTLEFTRGEPREHLPDHEALLAWLATRGLVSDRLRVAESARLKRRPAEAARWLDRFAHLRTLLHDLVGRIADGRQPTQAQLRDLNHILRHGLHYHQLRMSADGTRFAVGQVGDPLDQARAAIAGSLASYLAASDAERLRTCANDGCRWLFVDRSPAGRRRWCDMRTCGNQAKVARHRARARTASPARPGRAGVRRRSGARPS